MDRNQQQKKISPNGSTFPVPVLLGEFKDNFTTNTTNKPSKEEIINHALKFHSQGNLSEASKYYEYFINQGYEDPKVFTNYGLILKNKGNLKAAEFLQRKAIKLKPDFAIAHANLGIILVDIGKLEEAELSTREAIKINPKNPMLHYNLGNILSSVGKLKEAESSLRLAIRLKPDYPEVYLNLGILLKEIGNIKEAELCTLKAIEYRPDYSEAYSNMANILRESGKLIEARKAAIKAIELKPSNANAYSNLGIILNDFGKLDEAESSLYKAIKYKPDYADAYFNLSLIELLKGNYESGLINYEFRLKRKNNIRLIANPILKKLEKGSIKKRTKGEKVLVICEQGLGDTLQYMRYVPCLKNQGFEVSFCAQEKLHSLIKTSGIDHNPLTPEQAKTIKDGKWIPLLSLLKYLQVNPKNPIVSSPYIFSTNALKEKWKNILSNEQKPVIAINWQGNPDMETTYQGRSIPLEQFSILPEHNEISLLSLQKGFGSEQLDHCSFKNKFVECQTQIDSIWDFLENAAIIENCDLIITCDTSIAHLAGGMGKKVWLLLRDIPFWTWGLKGENTFWYPSMRLFRQRERGNWDEVMERVSNEIKNGIEGST